MEQSVLNRWHIKYERRRITQKKEYNMFKHLFSYFRPLNKIID